MVSKLPRWVEYGSFILAFVAGLINSIGLLGFKHQSISHLSGTATLLGTELVNSTLLDSYYLFIILISFLFGGDHSGILFTQWRPKAWKELQFFIDARSVVFMRFGLFLN